MGAFGGVFATAKFESRVAPGAMKFYKSEFINYRVTTHSPDQLQFPDLQGAGRRHGKE